LARIERIWVRTTDGATLVTTSQDTTARLWNVSNPDAPILLAAPLAGNDETVHSAVFSPDLHTLAMVGRDRDVRLWETDVDRAVTEICTIVTRPLPPDQWDHYFPGQEYEPTCPTRPASKFRNPTAEPSAGSTRLVASNSGKCVAIKDDGALVGAPAYQIGCTGALGESWMIRDEPAAAPGNTRDRIVKIVNAASDMCLESAEAEQRVGDATLAVQRPCIPGYDAQHWILTVLHQRADSVDVKFLGLKHRDCLNINGEAMANGAYVVRWPCHEPEPHKNEIFQLRPDAISR
jgi:Ricin-type beta-trefoil lectin domain-like